VIPYPLASNREDGEAAASEINFDPDTPIKLLVP
jgi:hypothetical protein